MANTHDLGIWRTVSYQLPIQLLVADSVAESECD